MNHLRKLAAFALACLMLFSAGAALAEKVTLKVWGSQDNQELLGQLIDEFKAANADVEWDISLGVVGEPDALARYNEDPDAAADLFSFPNNVLSEFVNADALFEVMVHLDEIKAANTAGSIESATLGEYLYGYPMTADNGYFMYYDKSVYSEEDVQTLDGMLAKAAEAGKKVLMDVSNGWYIASFFLGAGCELGKDENGKGICDFNSPAGLAAAEAIKAFCANEAFITGDNDVLVGGIGTTIAAGVSGTWNATAIKEKLGENYAACKLPTFTCGGEQVQMASFIGTKIMGVNTQTDFPLEAMKLAEFLTGEEAQIKFFEVREFGPTNIVAASNPAVLENAALAALSAQSAHAISQKMVPDGYWSPAEAFGLELETKATADLDLQGLLDNMVAQITQ